MTGKNILIIKLIAAEKVRLPGITRMGRKVGWGKSMFRKNI